MPLVESVSVVVPVYNSERGLAALIERLAPVLAASAREYEAVLVDDGSRDASWAVIRELSRANPWVRGLRLMRNFGQHNALLCGIRAARFEVIVTIDDDLQHPPEEIPRLLAPIAAGEADVVYGAPERQRHGLVRNLASWVTRMTLEGAMGVRAARNLSAFRAFRTRLRDAFAGYESPQVCIDAMLSWGTGRFDAVRVRHDARAVGASNYNVRRLVSHALTMMTSYSAWPLRMASVVGFGFTLFGFGVLAYVLVQWMRFGSTVPGFAFLASIIAIFSGAQLFALGVLGEYLARIHARSLNRPPYTIAEKTPARAAEPTGGEGASQ